MSAPYLRTLAAAVLLMVVATYIAVIRPIESTVAERYADLDSARVSLERSAILMQRLPALERERATLGARLARLHLRDSRAALVDRFLHAVARTSQRDAVAIQSVAADPRPAADLALDITIRGPYTRLIAAVRDLDSTDVAARIALTSLGNAQNRPGARPQLDATFHVVLLRDIDEISIRPSHAI
jgi:hypothetical protein